MAELYVRIEDVVHGPYTVEVVKRMAASGRITPDDSLKRGEKGEWKRAASFQGLHFGRAAENGFPASTLTIKTPLYLP